MLMTVFMEDAKASLGPDDCERLTRGVLADLLYADDTLLLSVTAASLERFLAAVAGAGRWPGAALG